MVFTGFTLEEQYRFLQARQNDSSSLEQKYSNNSSLNILLAEFIVFFYA